MIFKLQRPLSSSLKNPPCLLYNRGRSIEAYVPMTAEIRKLLGDNLKVYIEGRVEGKSVIIAWPVEDQEW